MKRRLLKWGVLGCILCMTFEGLLGQATVSRNTQNSSDLKSGVVSVSGEVTVDGAPMEGVTVFIKGAKGKSVLTDGSGKYSINALPTDSLQFMMFGSQPKTEFVGNQSIINVEMSSDVQTLKGVVAIGYGTVKKSDATGAVTQLDDKSFAQGAIPNSDQLLVGQVAGVDVGLQSGQPGAGAQIRIRGGSSLKANNDPLIILDGMPIVTSNADGSSGVLSTINPNDIESFNVLKDASATAIYGSRASNGVIIITTKKGKAGSKIRVN